MLDVKLQNRMGPEPIDSDRVTLMQFHTKPATIKGASSTKKKLAAISGAI